MKKLVVLILAFMMISCSAYASSSPLISIGDYNDSVITLHAKLRELGYYGFGWLVKWTEPWWKQWWPRVKNTVMFFCLAVFLGIVFNFDLYHTGDGIVSIAMRCIAGFAGNAVLLAVCEKYTESLGKVKLDKLGMYTLEIYATHMCVNNLMEIGQGFFTAAGFGNFICSFILTVVFTTVIIATFKAIPATDFIFYGKKQKFDETN